MYMGLECISEARWSGEGMGLEDGVSARGVVGCEATFASNAEALVGLPEPESLRLATGVAVVRHGEETVDGVRGGRRLPERWCEGAWVGSE